MGMAVIFIPIQLSSHSHNWLDVCPILIGFPFPMRITFPRSSLLQIASASQTTYRGFALDPTGGLLAPNPLADSLQMKIDGTSTVQHNERLLFN